jgi:hypothetical protein
MTKGWFLSIGIGICLIIVVGLFVFSWQSQATPVYPRTAVITIENGLYVAIYPVNSTTWYDYTNGTSGFYYGGPRFSSSNFTEVLEWGIAQTK